MVVIKIGGEVIDSVKEFEKFKEIFLSYKPVLVVFGGGVQISEKLKSSKIPFQFYKGERITTPEMIKIISSEFEKIAEEIKKRLKPEEVIFLRGEEIFLASQKSKELGLVGRVVDVKEDKIFKEFEKGKSLLISPLGSDAEGRIYNINADISACGLAIKIKAEKLIFVTKVEGVYYNGKLLEKVECGEVDTLIEKEIISGGMIPKVRAGMEALQSGVKQVYIGNTVLV